MTYLQLVLFVCLVNVLGSYVEGVRKAMFWAGAIIAPILPVTGFMFLLATVKFDSQTGNGHRVLMRNLNRVGSNIGRPKQLFDGRIGHV